ncbi:hypothetical protein WA158_007758 [Blastocystis sp. Blastoise]
MESTELTKNEPKYFFGDDVFKDVMNGLIDTAWKTEWEKLDSRVQNRKNTDIEEFCSGVKELASIFNGSWLRNVINKCKTPLNALKVLTEKLYSIKLEWKAETYDFSDIKQLPIDKRQYLPILMFGLIPLLPSEAQLDVYSYLMDCVNNRMHNLEIFFEMDILRKLIFMVMSKHATNFISPDSKFEIPNFHANFTDAVLNKIMDFIYLLASHSVRTNDLRAILLPFRLGAFATEEEEQQQGSFRSVEYLGTLLKIANAPLNPPAFFSWSEPATGLQLPPTPTWPKNGYGFICWLRIEAYPVGTSMLPIASLKGYAGRGIDIYIRDHTLYTRVSNDKNDVSLCEYKLTIPIQSWTWIGVTHAKKAMWRSSIQIYINGQPVYDEKLKYPENVDGNGKVGMQAFIGTSPDIDTEQLNPNKNEDYRFQMSSAGIFNQSLSASDMATLFQIHSNDSFSLTDMPNSIELVSEQARLLEKTVGYYEARNTRGTDCFDCTNHQFHGRIGENTRIATQLRFSDALSSLGGIPVILPMFVPPWGDIGLNTLPLLVPQPLPSRAYIQALSFLVLLLQDDPAQVITFKNAGGIELLSCLLRRAPSTHVTVELVTVIQQICLALKNRDDELYKTALKYMLFDFSLWGPSPYLTHMIVLQQMDQLSLESPKVIKTVVGLRPLLECLETIYYIHPSDRAYKRHSTMTSDLMKDFQIQIITIIQRLLSCEGIVTKQDICDILSFIYHKPEDSIIILLLNMLTTLLSQSTLLNNLVITLRYYDLPTILLSLISSTNEEIRYLSLNLIHIFWSQVRIAVKDISSSRNTISPFNITNDYASCISHCINAYPADTTTYRILMEFALGLKPDSIEGGIFESKKTLAIQCPAIISTIMEYTAVASEGLTVEILSHLVKLLEGPNASSNNKIAIAKTPNITYHLISLCISSPNDELQSHCVTILSSILIYLTFSKVNGWECLESIRSELESFYITTSNGSDKSEENTELSTSTTTTTTNSKKYLDYSVVYVRLLRKVLTTLYEKIKSNTFPKRSSPTGNMVYEGYAMSIIIAINYLLCLTPSIPRVLSVDDNNQPLINTSTTLPAITTITDDTCDMIDLCISIYEYLIPQINGYQDICIIKDPNNIMNHIPVMSNGIIPAIMRAIEAEVLHLMKKLFEGGELIKERKEMIMKRIENAKSIMIITKIIIEENDDEEEEQASRPQSDWMNQLTMNCAYIVFTLLGISVRIVETIKRDPLGPKCDQKQYWDQISELLWSLLRLLLLQLSSFLKDVDNVLFGSLSHLKTKNAQDLFSYPAWIPLFTHDIFKASSESMDKLFIHLLNDICISDDTRILFILQEQDIYKKNLLSDDNDGILSTVMVNNIIPGMSAMDKDNLNTLLERETLGLKNIQKLWRELIIGPCMWHGDQQENEIEYWQLDRRESFKRLRNRLKRDWHERPHRSINRVEATKKSLKETLESSGQQEKLMNMKLAINKQVDIQDEEEEKSVSPAPDTPTPNSPSEEQEEINIDVVFSHGERVVYTTEAELVMPMSVVEGRIEITPQYIYYFGEKFSEGHEGPKRDLRTRKWKLDDITEIYRRRYLLAPTALEFYLNSKSYLINFRKQGDNLKVFKYMMDQKPAKLRAQPLFKYLHTPQSLVAKADWTYLWRTHQMSNFEYLMHLNIASGRTYNDIQQYPVFPWILADYTSDSIDLSDPSVYRDLSKPIGALNEDRLEKIMFRYNSMDDADIPKFMYGSHYSNVGTVLFYLIRTEPFAELNARLQGGHFDWADRLFYSMEGAWKGIMTSPSDLKELTPEFFYNPHFLKNSNHLDMGTRQDGKKLDDVILPPWAKNAEEFIRINMEALESDYVSEHLHEWIDLIFGYKQRGIEAEKAHNVFYYLTYEGMVDMSQVTDPLERSSIESQIAFFGQTPSQLFTVPHPKRYNKNDALQALGLKSLPGTIIHPQPLETLHEGTLLSLSFRNDEKDIVVIDDNGMCSIMKYQPSIPGHKLMPFSLIPSDKPCRNVLPQADSLASTLTSRVVRHKDSKVEKTSNSTVRARIAVDSNNNMLISTGHWDCTLRIKNLDDDTPPQKYVYQSVIGSCVSLTEDGKEAIMGTREGLVLVWDLVSLAQQTTINQSGSKMLGRLTRALSSKSKNGSSKGNEVLPRLILLGLPSKVVQVNGFRDLDLIVAATQDNIIYLFNLSNGRYVNNIDVTKDLPQLPVSTEKEGEKEKEKKIPYIVRGVLTTWRGYLLIAVGANINGLKNYILCYDINGTLLYTRDDVSRIHSLCSSTDSSWLFAASNQTICVYTLPDLMLNTVLQAPTNVKYESICVSNDTRALLAGTAKGKILIYGLNLIRSEREETMIDEEDAKTPTEEI